MEGGFLFCGWWNFSKSVSVGHTFIREMRVTGNVVVSNKNSTLESTDANKAVV